MLVVGDTQYESDPGVLDLLKTVLRKHEDAIGYMALIEDKIHVTVKTPKPKPAKRGKARPNADAAQSDAPEAKSEQAPAKPPHLEVLQWTKVPPSLRTRPGCGHLLQALTVRGDIWGLMTAEQRELALLTKCLELRVTLPEDGGEPKIGKASLPIQTHPYVVTVGGAWWEGLDPCSVADATGEVDVAAALLSDGEPARRTAADLPADALAGVGDEDEPY